MIRWKHGIQIGMLWCITVWCFGVAQADTVREPVVSGAFYPADPHELTRMIDYFLSEVSDARIDEKPAILVVPHAGYVYSGPVAAHAFKQVQGRQYESVIIIAFSHHVYQKGVSIFDGDAYKTPLGLIPIDTAMVEALRTADDDMFHYYPDAHAREHSLEVELPFLQRVMPASKIVPIIMCDQSYDTAQRLSKAIETVTRGRDVLVVVSTDLSHYHPYQDAQKRDLQTVDIIQSFSVERCAQAMQDGTLDACGKGPIMTAMFLANAWGITHVPVSYSANSGDTAGDKSRVVGYAAMVLTKGKGENAMSIENKKPDQLIPDTSRETLLSLARTMLSRYFADHGAKLELTDDISLLGHNGAFVTLHKQGRLRGCIGCFISDKPLYQTVQDFVINSAVHDPRFPAVTADELDDIDIEISVLSPMRKIDSIAEFQLGKHGILIKKGFRSGTFLPQVADDTGWTAEEFLGHCAQDKAGIGWDGWKDADLYVYTAEVFGENE